MESKQKPREVVLDIGYSPGDIVVFTGALRDLKLAHPEMQVRVETCCPAIFENNPHVYEGATEHTMPSVRPNATNLTELGYDWTEPTLALWKRLAEERKLVCVCEDNGYTYYDRERHLPLFWAPIQFSDPDTLPEYHRVEYDRVHESGKGMLHFSTAFHLDLQDKLGVDIPQTSLLPDIHLSDEERGWRSQVEDEFGYSGPFWLLNAGYKSDYPLKAWGADNWQALVDRLRDRVQFVQVGEMPEYGPMQHTHPALNGVLDLRGKTDLRQLIRLCYHAQGAVCHVTLLMHLMAAFRKPCVAVAGGREPRRWEEYPHHRYIDTCGQLPCCDYDGCWLSGRRDDPSGVGKTCRRMAGGRPLCMQLIRPERVADEILAYYRGGVL